ncbi:MAG TPA: hypothetical protein VF526_05270 [Solirubrobacteraceae bacterium]
MSARTTRRHGRLDFGMTRRALGGPVALCCARAATSDPLPATA